ncbi:MAG TPA: cytochrome c [Verrucomicrobiae bacterium]|jgi:mono/diheme cytochrome c family protein|nr:cytochrome c [Verrucomicrobiae bacterium]
MSYQSKSFLILVVLVVSTALVFATSNGAWLNKVPERDRDKVNPYRDQPDAVAAGQRVFHDHCAHCHGEDAEGTKKRPSLRTERVQQQATEGDLHWLLVNGSMGSGMPTWSKLGDPQIWQVITYVRSLKVEQAAK